MAFRAFYALPVDNFTTSTGQSTNAVHGFVSMFLSLLDSERPTHVAVAFDLPGGTFRTEEYAEYKGTRDETPQPFLGQVELIQEVLEAMGVTALTAPGYEADDILATLAASAQAEGAVHRALPGQGRVNTAAHDASGGGGALRGDARALPAPGRPGRRDQ